MFTQPFLFSLLSEGSKKPFSIGKLYGDTTKVKKSKDSPTNAAETSQGEPKADVPAKGAETKQVADKKKKDVKPVGPPTDVVLTDWLQFIRRAFTDRVSGSYRPRVGIVIAAWDGVPIDNIDGPPVDYLAENFPLLSQFMETNDERFDFEVFGLSILGGDLKNDAEFRDAFVKGKPNEFGYVIHSLLGEQQRAQDVTIPVAWALGWVTENSSTESTV